MAKIKNKLRYPVKEEPTLDDYVVGTCAVTGKTRSFSIRKLLGLSECCDGDNLITQFNYFQFENLDLSKDINDIGIVDAPFLEANGDDFTEETALNEIEITFTRASRFGFVISNTTDNSYRIFDPIGNDITDTGFDKSYNNTEKKLFFVSKEYIAPSTLKFKFEKTT